jgi:hypothetical protein
MQANQLAKLLGALAILFGIAYFSGAFNDAPTTIELPSVQISTSDVDRIEVITPAHTVIVEKSSGEWIMKEPVARRADSTAIVRFLGELDRLTFNSVVALSPDRYERYGVDSTAFVTKVDDGTGVHVITMSPNGPNFSTVYMRVDDDERVFSASPRLSLPLSVALWRDKKIVDVPSLSVLRATVVTPDEEYSLSRDTEAGGWTLSHEGSTTRADSTALASWFARMSPLKGDGFVDEESFSAEPTHSVRLEIVDGTSLMLSAIKEESRFLLKMEPSEGEVYFMYASRANPLFPSSDSFIPSE